MPQQPDYRFDHVHIYCSDIAVSEQWFVEKLGAELIRRRGPKPSPASDLLLGGTTILLREQTPDENLGPAGPSRFGTDHIGLVVSDLDATAAELRQRGIEFEVEPQQVRPDLKMSFIKGPDRLRIEIVQRAG